MNPDDASQRDEQVDDAIAEYLEAAELGRAPDQAHFIAAHPEIAAELREFFADRERFRQFARPIAGHAGHAAPTLGSRDGTPAVAALGAVHYFGDYELLEEIARGGMGVVYRARQTTLKRVVALKMILTGQLASGEDVKRFHAEAEAAARLEHPNIVPIFEIGQAEGQHYFSMAFVEGESLAHRIARGVLPPREAAAIMLKVARAIAFAHVEGVVHRDVKPANILLDTAGEPHVTDFGLAKRVAAAETVGESLYELTATGQILGTPSYMPPEQASGRTKDLGPLADVYSLGAVLYCAITGRPPFQAASPLDTLLQVIEEDPVAPRKLNPVVPRDLETICLKCLQKNPCERYASAADLADELDRFLQDEPIRARPVGVVEQTWRRARKHHRFLNSIVASVVATIVLAVLGSVGWDFYRRQQLSLLTLTTDGYPLTAELLHETEDRVQQSFTVPTETPIEIRAGEYRLRTNGSGMLGQTFHVSLDSGGERTFNIDLREQQLWKPIRLESGEEFELVDIEGRTDILLLERRFGRAALRRLDGATGESRWESPLGASLPEPGPESKDVWRQLTAEWGQWGASARASSHPLLVKPAVDLDGDGKNDLAYCWPMRDDVPLVALSGGSGAVLWQRAWTDQNQLAAPPLSTDVNGDGRPDLIVVGYRLGSRGMWVEALSGDSGETLWRKELNELKPENNATRYEWVSVRHDFRFWCGVEVVSRKDGPALAIRFDQHVAGLRLRGGDSAWTTIDLGARSEAHPQFFDSDGDGETDGIAMFSMGANGRDVDLTARSLADGKPMWSASLPLDSMSVRFTDLRLRRLPHMVDLDHDGKAEFVAPYEQRTRLTVSVVDSETGRARWERTISPSSQSHWQNFLQYPDINGDGHDELAVVSACFLSSDRDRRDYAGIFVDVLSGKDGRPLSWWRGGNFDANQRRIESIEIGPLGSDGRPELMITTVFRHYVQISSLRDVYLIAAARGVETHRLGNVHATRLADFNGDGLADLFVARETREGMQLHVLAGAAPEAWRRLGDAQPAQDYNGDGVTEAVEIAGDKAPRLRIISGQDGRVLSRPAIEWQDPRIAELPVVTAPPLPRGDLDGDGVADLLVASSWRAPFRRNSQLFPLMAISGATGRRLWDSPSWTMGRSLRKQGAFGVSIIALQPFCGDLDRDGTPEIVCPHRIFWHGQGQNSGFISQVCLTVIGGRDGRVVWTEAIGKPTNLNYVMHEYQLPYAVSPDLEDLNGDGAADLVITAPDYRTRDSIQDISCDVWSLSGRDGSPLWTPQPLKRVVPPYYVQNNQLATAAVGDLDGDGEPEIAVADVDTSNRATGLVFRLLVLGGKNGKPRWDWTWKHPANSTDYMPAVVLADLDGDGRKSVGVRFFDESPNVNKDTLVFFHAAGRERLRITGNQEWEYFNPRATEVRAVDLTKDGKEDLALMTGRSVKAFDNTGKLLWETSASGWMPIEDVVPGRKSPTFVIGKDHTYFGVEGSSGKVLWRGEGIRPDSQSATGTHTWQLTSRQGSDAPRIMSRRDHVLSRVSLPTDAAGKILKSAPPSEPNRTARSGDPRLLRRLPWDDSHGIARELLIACGFSLVLVVMPGAFLYRMVRKRRWSLRSWMMFPLVIAVMISSVYIFAKLPIMASMQRSDNPYLHVVFVAINGTMILPFPCLALVWAARRRWIRLGFLVGASLLFALAAAVIAYLNAARLLDPLEQFEWTWRGCWNLWLPMAIVTGWVALVVAGLARIVRRVPWSGNSRRRQT